MNKKMYAFIGLAAILMGAATTGCGSKQQQSVVIEKEVTREDYNLQKLFAYTPSVPEDQMVAGKQTALSTIENFLGKEVEVDDDYITACFNNYAGFANNDKDVYNVYRVCYYDDSKYTILFMFQDDTKVVEATDVNQAYTNIEDGSVNPEYMNNCNEKNFSNGAFASYYNHESNLILSQESGYSCSSIWTYEQDTNKVKLIWMNSESPIWQNYT